MPRVAFVTTSFPRTAGDGAGHFVAAEARRRHEEGDEVVVLAPGPRDGTDDPGARGGPRVAWLGGGTAFGFPGALERIRRRPWRAAAAALFVHSAGRFLRDAGPFDEIVAHFLVPSGFPISLGAPGSLEVVCHGSDVRAVERLPGPIRRRIVRSLLERGARFRFVSRELRERLSVATFPDALAESRVEPSPLDMTGAPGRELARAVLGVAPGERLAVVVGRLVRGKRPGVAIELALGAGASRVVVVGGGPLAAPLRARYPSAELVGSTPRPRALAWIAAADLLCAGSADEGAPTVVREARALGVPVLCVPAGDLREWARLDPGITLVRA